MKDAQYYIDRIIDGELNDDEWLALEKEVDEWWKHAPKEEQDLYSESGYGETLYMVCSGIRYMRDPANSDVYYWYSNQEWFVEDRETMTVRLTEKAPPRAVESFKRYETEMFQSKMEMFQATKEKIYELIETSLSAELYEEDENPRIFLFDNRYFPDLDMEKEKRIHATLAKELLESYGFDYYHLLDVSKEERESLIEKQLKDLYQDMFEKPDDLSDAVVEYKQEEIMKYLAEHLEGVEYHECL